MTKVKVTRVEETKESFREKMSDLLEDMWERIGRYHHGVSGHVSHDETVPKTDLSEAASTLTYQMDLPGLDENDIEIEIDTGRLTVSGERSDQREESGENYIFSERHYGRFARSFLLPPNVEQDSVKARFDKGVLKITVPYNNTSGSPRKIKVDRD